MRWNGPGECWVDVFSGPWLSGRLCRCMADGGEGTITVDGRDAEITRGSWIKVKRIGSLIVGPRAWADLFADRKMRNIRMTIGPMCCVEDLSKAAGLPIRAIRVRCAKSV